MFIQKIYTLLVSSVLLTASCTDTITVQAGEYEDHSKNGNSAGIGPITSIQPLNNPDRGFHLESNYLADNLTNPYTPEVYPDGFIAKRLEMYGAKNDGLTLTQLYIYLTEWVNKDISQEGLDNIQTLFNGLKENGYKAILRFAYNHEGLNSSGGESRVWIERHLEQLTPLIRENLGLIATIQVGFLGAWGEWHTTPVREQADRNAVVNALLETYPAPYCVEIRYPDLKNALTLANESNRNRIGFCNDYFTAGEHPLAPGNDFVPGSEWYSQVEEESPYYYVSGEIPYDEDTEWGLAKEISTVTTMRILRDHHYSAFDITQNYALNISSWKRSEVTPSLLDAHKILYSPDYFKDEEGKLVARSFFEFVRDHLGYRLNLLPSSNIEGTSGTLTYELNLTNTGFSTVINPKPVYLVCINSNGQVEKEILLENVDPKDWQPFDPVVKSYEVLTHTIKGSIDTGLSGTYQIGIWMPDATDALRYNNLYDIKWGINEMISHWEDENGKYTINKIGEVTF